MPDKRRDRRIRVADRHFKKIREVVSSRLAIVINARVQRLVAAVSVDEHPRVLRAVVKLGVAHRRYLTAECGSDRPAYFIGVDGLRRSFVECNGSGLKVNGIFRGGDVLAGGEALHIVDALNVFLGQREGFLFAVGGNPQAALTAEPVDLLHLLTATGGRNGDAHKRSVTVDVLKCSAVPLLVLRAVEHIYDTGEAKHVDILARVYVSERYAHKLAGRVVVELPEFPVAGGEKLLMPADEARPYSGHLEITALWDGGDAVKLPCVPIAVGGDAVQLPDVACIAPPVITGVRGSVRIRYRNLVAAQDDKPVGYACRREHLELEVFSCAGKNGS